MSRSFATAYKRLRHNVGSKQLAFHEHESECVRSLEYDPDRQQMTVEFVKRGTYVFFDIEPYMFAEFNNSASRGGFFNLYLRPYLHNFERIS